MTKVFFSVRRLQRGEEAKRGRYGLNLVPLMDVFTILVFFFLVHASEVAPTSNNNVVRLPESVADTLPRQTLVVTLTSKEILLQDLPVALVDAALEAPEGGVEALERALRERAVAGGSMARQADTDTRELTIMADRSIPFRLLRKVMLSCNRAGYQRIALSVSQKPSPGSDG